MRLILMITLSGFHLEKLARGEVGGVTLIKMMGTVTEF